MGGRHRDWPGEDFVMMDYLGIEVLPDPMLVVDFDEQLLQGENAGQPFPARPIRVPETP